MDCTLALRRWANEHALPATLEEIAPFATYTVPMEYHLYPEVEAVVLTSLTQVKWILQLVRLGPKWVLHIDGKHKLHHGRWILMTFGTHCLQWDEKPKVPP